MQAQEAGRQAGRRRAAALRAVRDAPAGAPAADRSSSSRPASTGSTRFDQLSRAIPSERLAPQLSARPLARRRGRGGGGGGDLRTFASKVHAPGLRDHRLHLLAARGRANDGPDAEPRRRHRRAAREVRHARRGGPSGRRSRARPPTAGGQQPQQQDQDCVGSYARHQVRHPGRLRRRSAARAGRCRRRRRAARAAARSSPRPGRRRSRRQAAPPAQRRGRPPEVASDRARPLHPDRRRPSSACSAPSGSWRLSPKRQQLAKLDKDIAAAQQTLRPSQQEKVQFAQAQVQFPTLYASLGRLGKAVPADEDVPSLLVQLNHAAAKANVDFRSVELKLDLQSKLARPGRGARAPARPAPPARRAPQRRAPAPRPRDRHRAGATGAAPRAGGRTGDRRRRRTAGRSSRFPSSTSSRATSSGSRT